MSGIWVLSRSAKRPALLMLVLGIFLVVVAVMATAQAILITNYFSAATLEDHDGP